MKITNHSLFLRSNWKVCWALVGSTGKCVLYFGSVYHAANGYTTIDPQNTFLWENVQQKLETKTRFAH